MATLNRLQDVVAKVAPILGTALTGPLGGAVISILAQQFGTQPTVDDVSAAVRSSDPEVVKANLLRAEAAFRAEAEKAITVREQISSHVEMMKMDYARSGFFSAWRPLAGWLATLFAAGTCGLVLLEGWNGKYDFLTHAPSVLMIGGPIMALAGIYAWGKSEERKAIVNSGNVLTDAISALTKR
jgi:hypothetical protein